MSEVPDSTSRDLADTRWILAQTHLALQDARQLLDQMDMSLKEAHSWLALVEDVQLARITVMNSTTQGVALESLARACQESAETGLGVDRRTARAVANLKAAVVMIDGLQPSSTGEQIDTGRLRRQLVSLQEDLQSTRPVMQRTSERLGAEAERTRQAVNGTGRGALIVDAQVVSRALHVSSTDRRLVDEELGRAQTVTVLASRGTDTISETARERMGSHRELPTHSPTPPPVSR